MRSEKNFVRLYQKTGETSERKEEERNGGAGVRGGGEDRNGAHMSFPELLDTAVN